MQVVDLRVVTRADLEDLWRSEVHFWRTRLLWDVSDTFAALQRIQERGGLPGVAVRANGRTIGFAYYGVAGRLGVISGLVVSPEWRESCVGETLVHATVDAIRRLGVVRIESHFVPSDDASVVPNFERTGFQTYWREFLRVDLCRLRGVVPTPTSLFLESWEQARLGEAASILQKAYVGSVDAEVHEQYRTVDGCHIVLDDILNQGVCGLLVAEASAIGRDRGRSTGFVLITEISPRQGHLTHIAVLPEYQGRGVGRGLLDYSLRRLTEGRFETLSLIVSRANDRALEFYRATGFQSVMAFPVFVWQT
jgi:ribosomal protein S18 acetylase RimI-like enzyme